MSGPRFAAEFSAILLVFLVLATAMAAPGAARAQAPAAEVTAPETFWVYVGTYTQGRGRDRSQGIYLMELDLRSGKLGAPRLVAKATDPSFLAIHPSRKFLYSVNELGEFQGHRGGGVSAYAIDPANGGLTPLNQQSSAGEGPCHLVVDRAGKNVLVANYTSGTVACLAIEPDGTLRPAASVIQHRGSGADPGRQAGPHAHSINLDAGNRFAVAADLGLDKVLIYAFDPANAKITPNEPAFAQVAPASGPRHFAFHPGGQFGYVINEMANTVTAFAYDPAKGSLTEIQTISTLPEDFKGRSYTAEVVAHPSGKFLYGSNRGHDSIAIFTIDASTGRLSPAGFEPTQGKNPRNFALDPTGTYLLAENMESNSIVVFRIDPQTGALRPTGQTVAVSKPVCIRMIPKPGGASR
ncbi:MAG TPA: lactonase family protein [Isosphaeraceae bacterium]|nr:lactonase family protein [Isosphaeraceae bacterium]